MSKKSVGLTILLWSEVIVSLRVLLFSLPVMINKNLAGNFSLSNLDDRFVVVMTTAAILYFAAGIMAISGFRFWKAAHYVGVVLVFLVTAGMLSVSGQSISATDSYYFFPVLFAVIITALSGILGGVKKAA